MIDAIARRYGVMPHDLRGLDYADWLYDLKVAELGAEHEAREMEKVRARRG